jgi:ribose-phosphate pyrophosphokinase
MKYLNLDKSFNPYNSDESCTIKYNSFTFPGGEPHIRIIEEEKWKIKDETYTYNYKIKEDGEVTITHRVNSFNDLGLLLVTVDALKRLGVKSISCFIGYFPGARQDRVCNEGEALTAKVYADIINSCGFDRVTIFDPHSDVIFALINNVKIINNHKFVENCIASIYKGNTAFESNMLLVSPDAGANKKIKDLCIYLGYQENPLIKCDKTRNTITGEIIGFEVYSDNLKGRDCIIVDDICSNGGTFMGLADELKKKNAGDLYLIVSHGEFGNDKEITLRKLFTKFKRIYCTDSIKSKYIVRVNNDPIVTEEPDFLNVTKMKDII